MGHVTKIDCTNCSYEETFSIGSTRRSHPSGGELKQCPSCDHIEVLWHKRYVIDVPAPKRTATNLVSKFIDWLEDRILGPEDPPVRRKVVEADPPKACSECSSITEAFDYTSEDQGTVYRYVNARCPRCHCKTLQSDKMPVAMFD